MGLFGDNGGLLGLGGLNKFNRAASMNNPYTEMNRSNFDLPGFQHQYNVFGNMAEKYGNRQIGRTADDDNARWYQMKLAQNAYHDMLGNGPGQALVRMQAQDAADRASQQQLAMAAGGRPGMAGMQYRNAAMNAGNAQSAVGGQAAMAGLQAQLAAQNTLGQVSGTMRGQTQANNQFNTDAQLRMYGLNDQAQLEALRQRLQAAQMQQQGRMGYEQNRTQRFGAMMGAPTTGEQMLGLVGGLGAGLMGMSK